MISESLDKDFSLHVHIIAERGSTENLNRLIMQYIPKNLTSQPFQIPM